MSNLLLNNLAKHYNKSVAVADVSIEIAEGEMVALLGPSGCGKTTTLRMVAGFIDPTAGQIIIGDQDVTQAPPYARDTGMVFQSYALFPHMSVAQNVSFGLEMRGVNRADRDRRITEALAMVRLSQLADRLPQQLSGGQQQRVALARALVINPSVFLLDEPLSNLDAKLRGEVQLEIRALQQRLGLTTLIVTHDQEEALTMADRLVVMEAGRVRQIGTPRELYEQPANAFVAGFVGRCNLIPGRIESAGTFRSASGASMACDPAATIAGDTMLAIRPERIELTGAEAGYQLRTITYLGANTEYHFEREGTALVAVLPTPLPSDPMSRLRPNDFVAPNWAPAAGRVVPLH